MLHRAETLVNGFLENKQEILSQHYYLHSILLMLSLFDNIIHSSCCCVSSTMMTFESHTNTCVHHVHTHSERERQIPEHATMRMLCSKMHFFPSIHNWPVKFSYKPKKTHKTILCVLYYYTFLFNQTSVSTKDKSVCCVVHESKWKEKGLNTSISCRMCTLVSFIVERI